MANIVIDTNPSGALTVNMGNGVTYTGATIYTPPSGGNITVDQSVIDNSLNPASSEAVVNYTYSRAYIDSLTLGTGNSGGGTTNPGTTSSVFPMTFPLILK